MTQTIFNSDLLQGMSISLEVNKITEETDYLDLELENIKTNNRIIFDIFGLEMDNWSFDKKNEKEHLGTITITLIDDDWINCRSQLSTYAPVDRPEFLATNDFEDLYAQTALRPRYTKEYIFVEKSSDEKAVLVEGRIAKIEELCLAPQHNNDGILKEVIMELSRYLEKFFKVDFIEIHSLHTLDNELQEVWENLESKEDAAGNIRVIYWGIPTIDMQLFEGLGFAESLNKVLIGKIPIIRNRLMGIRV
ncbi:hypothetical protein COF34_09080 [Bacillus toyonensis]|uniref:hypothetical protein n=1 Tax=Bacillus toyonensis TaxID=155322 RepID=UPI000BFDDC53|nr:hypothetical protein [Bacillus toyonensis]PHC59982.1 hypothetical protein COF34_09080 [Bacillus toyonensis]